MGVGCRSRISAIDVIDRILDKGVVIEHEARISLLGVDLCTTVETRVLITSIDTFVHYAPAVRKTGRLLDLLPEKEPRK